MDAVSNLADTTDGIITRLAIPIEIAHYTLVISGLRNDWDPKKSRQQPFATWFMSLMCCMGGGMLVHLFTGKPAFTPLLNTQSLLFITIVWWHIFYSPKDSIYSTVTWKPLLLIIVLMKEMIRTRKIIKAAKIARSVYPDSLLVCTFLGMLGACGGGFVRNGAIMIRSKWNHDSVKNFAFAGLTKFCLLFSLLYNLQANKLIPLTVNMIAMLQLVTLFLCSASMKLGYNFDPFSPIERTVASFAIDYSAFGGEEDERPAEKETTKKQRGEEDERPAEKETTKKQKREATKKED